MLKAKFLSLVALLVFATASQASLIVGNTYLDSSNKSWIYVGDYNVGDGPAWPEGPANYSAIDAAVIVFGVLPVGSYAISTLDSLVDHRAWYDGYGDGTYLPLYNSYGGGLTRAEDFFVDVGAAGYNDSGDYSAYVGGDRAAQGGGAFNHVFRSADVPEPATIALLGLGLLGFAAARRRKQ